MKKEYIDTDEVPQDKFDNTEGGGSNGHGSMSQSIAHTSWWYVVLAAVSIIAAIILSYYVS